jgi:hypothetical protein
MIFPELPRHYYNQKQSDILHYQANKLNSQVDNTLEPKTPLQGSALDEWMIAKGYWQQPTDPAAGYRNSDPVDWFARDAIEFYALCIIMTVWISVWLGIHRGWW